jgi:hypothetical protein
VVWLENFNKLLKERSVTYKPAGDGKIYTDPDADRAREYFRDKKPRKMVEKLTTVDTAVSEMINDGD